jgi:uncharacterized protein
MGAERQAVEEGRRRRHARGEQERGRAALECGDQRLGLIVARIVGPTVATAAAVLVVGITLERRRGVHRQDDGAGRGIGPPERLRGKGGGVRHVARHCSYLRSFLLACYSGARSDRIVIAIAMFARRWLLLLPLLLALAATVARAQLAQFPTATLTIVTASGSHKFTVELATTPAQMAQGLMFRQSLAADAGMLFDFAAPSMATMWMKNTLIPLDMLFVDAGGHVVNIGERAVPGSLETIAAAAPVRAVIELNGGTAGRLGIRPGDRVIYPIFGNTSN